MASAAAVSRPHWGARSFGPVFVNAYGKFLLPVCVCDDPHRCGFRASGLAFCHVYSIHHSTNVYAVGMAEIICKMYLFRGDPETVDQMWLEAEDGRAWFVPVGKLPGYTAYEAALLPHDEAHRNLTLQEKRDLPQVYEYRSDVPFDPDTAERQGWTLGTPPKIEKSYRPKPL